MAELRTRRRLGVGIVAVACALILPREGQAQLLHWDASAQVGANTRFVTKDASGGGIGPIGQLTGHVALLPLLRVGGYFGHDMVSAGDYPWRQVTFGGLRAKGMLPWVRGAGRAWLFAGFGYARSYAPSYQRTFLTDPSPTRFQGVSGGFFDVPFGIGASYTFFKPWALCAELAGRAEFGNTGRVSSPLPPLSGQGIVVSRRTDGVDRFALGLTAGILVDF